MKFTQRKWKGYNIYQREETKITISNGEFRGAFEVDHWLTADEAHALVDRHIEELKPKDREFENYGMLLTQSPANWSYTVWDKATSKLIMRGAYTRPLSEREAFFILDETKYFFERLFKKLEEMA